MDFHLFQKNVPVEDLDNIVLGCVTRAVDDLNGARETFSDDKGYWEHVRKQIDEFAKKIPNEYCGTQLDVETYGLTNLKICTYKFRESPQNLRIGTRAGYHLLSTNGERTLDTAFPTFTLIFQPTDTDSTKKILSSALHQFFLMHGDKNHGDLYAYGSKRERISQQGMKLLSRFLPHRSKIDIRCDWGHVNSKARYRT
jgi:hypothetical protein